MDEYDLAAQELGGVALEPQGADEYDLAAKELGGVAIEQPSIQAIAAPEDLLRAYSQGTMTPDVKAKFEADVQSGAVTVPAWFYEFKPKKAEPQMPFEKPKSTFDNYFDKAMAIGEAVQEHMTGAKRSTPEIEAANDWTLSPEMNELSAPSVKLMLGSIIASPEETIKMLKEQFPQTKVRQDEQGNYLFTSKDGETYGIKPGFRWSDAPRAAIVTLGSVIAGMAAPTAAGGGTLATAKNLISAGASEAGLESIFEGLQVAAGGDFDKLNVALAGAFGAGAEGLQRGYRALFGDQAEQMMRAASMDKNVLKKASKDVLGDISERPVLKAEQIQEMVENPLRLPDEMTQGGQVVEAVSDVGKTIPDEAIPTPKEKEALGQQFAKAANKPNEKQLKKIAESANIEPEILEAADRLGYTKFLDPDHMSADFAFKELSQLQKSQKGSALRATEQENLKKIGSDAKAMIEKFGGTENLGGLSDDIQNSMDNMVNRLSALSEKQYGIINKRIPEGTVVPVDNLMQYFDSKITKIGGDHKLNSTDSEIYNKLTKEVKLEDGTTVRVPDENTYDYIDEVRKDVGAKTRQRDKFNDEEKSIYKMFYALLTEAQEDALNKLPIDVVPQWERAKKIVQARKGIEDDMKALYGSKINQSFVQKLIGANQALDKTDATKFVALIKSIPKQYRQEFTASAILKSFGKENENGVLNYNTFPVWYTNMSKNPQAKAALMSNLPEDLRVYLDDLHTVTKGIRDSTIKYSGTGASLQLYYEPIDSLKKKVANVAVDLAKMSPVIAGSSMYGGPVGTGITTTYALMNSINKQKTPLVEKVNELFRNPKFKETIIDSARETITEKTNGQGLVNTSKKLAEIPAFKAFAKAANLPKDTKALQAWILAGLRAERQQEEQD